MKTLAAIDIGASALRMMIAQVQNRKFKVLEKISYPLRLGEDTFIQGYIGPKTLQQAIDVLKGFTEKFKEYGVEQVRVVATSAVRESKNRDFIVEQIRLKTGLRVSILEKSEEQRLVFLGLKRQIKRFNPMLEKGMVFMRAGSGNVEIFLMKKNDLFFSTTIPIGGLRLRENLKDVPGLHFADTAERYIHSEFKMLFQNLQKIQTQYFLGSGTLLKWIVKMLDIKNGVISLKDLKKLYSELKDKSSEQIVKNFRIPMEYSDLMAPAVFIYYEFLKSFEGKEILFQEISFNESLLLDQANLLERSFLTRKIWKTAVNTGKKYRFDEKHGLQVANLALQIFDDLHSLHNLPRRYRFLLRLAALWHDIGIFIQNSSHHKHSYYLISNIEIPGLSKKDLHLIATIARYHRKSLPKRHHHEYNILTPREKVIASKLIAFLRIADGLDRSHSQLIKKLDIKIKDDRILFTVENEENIWIEKLYFQKKKNLFVRLFGMDAVLQ